MSALCLHFGTCGGCAHQDLPDADYRVLKRGMVERALARHGVEAEVGAIVEVAPATRRRCVFKIAKREGAVLVGFHARASHSIVDMHECRVLTPGLFGLVGPLRAIMGEVLSDSAEAHVTETESGFDIALRWRQKASAPVIARLAAWAERHKVARITAGSDVLVALGAPKWEGVELPPNAFLQPTREGEAFLQARVGAALSGAKRVADLFAGCGTFALALARRAKVHAVELDAQMLAALAAAARATRGLKPVTTEKRDLFKQPLGAKELDAFDAVSLDPPRAGAAAQMGQIARSGVRRVAYVSCNAETFAHDARLLVDAGFRIGNVVPVDQFLWSEHIELLGVFTRG
jgi:23S rRNA (uracil1939-C5)-methyltransferase